MKHSVLLDYTLATAQDGFIVRALLKLEGQAPTDAARRRSTSRSCSIDRGR